MENKEIKVQMLADKLSTILLLLDSYINNFDDEEFELLKEVRETLKEKINTNNSALPLIFACGGTYDDTDDRFKIKTLDCLIELIKIRNEYKEQKVKALKEQKNKAEVLKLFGLMGI